MKRVFKLLRVITLTLAGSLSLVSCVQDDPSQPLTITGISGLTGEVEVLIVVSFTDPPTGPGVGIGVVSSIALAIGEISFIGGSDTGQVTVIPLRVSGVPYIARGSYYIQIRQLGQGRATFWYGQNERERFNFGGRPQNTISFDNFFQLP